MIAVDTNVVIRLLTGDDESQAADAKSLFSDGQIWIPKTVLLETEWVLRRVYEFSEQEIREALSRLLGLPNVHAEDENTISGALALMEHGVEFADALHLSSRPQGAKFVSFDREFVRRASRAGVTGISGVRARRSR